MKNIDISDETFARLEACAVGFDSPEAVIVRLLDKAEGKPESKPEIIFKPADEEIFRQQLLQYKNAKIVLYKADGQSEVILWNAARFSETSNLRGNLWSGHLRGWRAKGIVRAELTILPNGDENCNE